MLESDSNSLLMLQHGPAPIERNGGFGPASGQEQEDSGPHTHLEHGNSAHALRIRDGRVRDWGLRSRFLTAGEYIHNAILHISAIPYLLV